MNRLVEKTFILVSLTLSISVYSQTSATTEENPEVVLDRLLKQVQESSHLDSIENRNRIEIFMQRRDEQAALLHKARNDVHNQERIGDELDAAFNANELELAELELQFNKKLGNFGELFGVTRQIAGDTRAQLENSLISAQYPDRERPMNEITSNKGLPTMEQLRNLWATLLQEQTEQGKVVRFTANVNDENGQPQPQQVIRLGSFTAVSSGKYLAYSNETHQLNELPRQPGHRFIRAADELQQAEAGKLINAVIDPSGGAILGMLVKTPDLTERIEQGGLVGYVVIGLAVIGLLIGLERLFTLWITSIRVKRQARTKEPSKKNPLGRVLMAYAENSFADVETLELKLDDAILKEVPKLERGLSTLKVLAGVAPLLGLLGTVTGMILTFQSITLWGTGDPKIMAGGISQALITTVLGLIAAIPLLLLHSMANGRAKLVQQVLEEHSAGLVANQAERSRHV